MPNDSKSEPASRSEPSIESGLKVLFCLGGWMDFNLDGEKARQALIVAHKSGGEPLEILSVAGRGCELAMQPIRRGLRDVLWEAADHQPLTTWVAERNDWLVILKYGFFKARVCWAGNPLEVELVSRSKIEKWLGCEKGRLVDWLLVSRQLMSGKDPEQDGDAAHDHHVSTPPIRRFLQLMRPEMPDIWTIVIFSVFTGLLYLALPLAVNALVSNVAFGSQSTPFKQALLVLGLLLFVALLLSASLMGLQHYLVEVIQRRLFVRLTADLAYRLPRVDIRSIDGLHAPELLNRFLDVVTMQKNTSLILLSGINLVLSAVIGMTVLGFYHPFLLAFSLGLLIFVAFIVLVFGRGAVKTSVAESYCKYDVLSWLEELARCPRLFKGSGGYQLAAEAADNLARDYIMARREHFRILLRQVLALLMVEVIASVALLTVGGWLVINQQLTLGQLVAAEIIVAAIVASIAKLGKQFEAWYDLVASVDKIGHLLDLKIERISGDVVRIDGPGARVVAEGCGFSYDSKNQVFENLNFTLEPGERVGLYGPQGSGTSTLLDLLHGGRQATSGSVEINGVDARSWSLEALRENVTLIRSLDIVNGSIADNVRLGRRDVSPGEVNEVLRKVGLYSNILDLPDGIDTKLLAGGLPLSSRQRIRLLIARALVQRPKLLLLDGLLDGLDIETRVELAELLTDPSIGWTVVFSTRHAAVLEHAQRVIYLAKGGQSDEVGAA